MLGVFPRWGRERARDKCRERPGPSDYRRPLKFTEDRACLSVTERLRGYLAVVVSMVEV